jgi:hypothetical protein
MLPVFRYAAQPVRSIETVAQMSSGLRGFRGLISKPIGAREVAIWSVLMVSVAFWSNVMRASAGDTPGLSNMLAHVLNNGAVDVLAWMLVIVRCGKLYTANPASMVQVSIAFLAGVIVLAPLRFASGLALTILGVLLLKDQHANRSARDVGLIFVALAVETVWTSSLLQPLHVLVGTMDASINVLMLRLFNIGAMVHANAVDNISANFAIAMWPGCTSSFPLASVGLLFIAVVLFLGQPLRRFHLSWLVASLIASILLTEIRLVLLALNETSYDWWHNGPGLSIYTIVALVPAVIFPILATRGHRMADPLLPHQLTA